MVERGVNVDGRIVKTFEPLLEFDEAGLASGLHARLSCTAPAGSGKGGSGDERRRPLQGVVEGRGHLETVEFFLEVRLHPNLARAGEGAGEHDRLFAANQALDGIFERDEARSVDDGYLAEVQN